MTFSASRAFGIKLCTILTFSIPLAGCGGDEGDEANAAGSGGSSGSSGSGGTSGGGSFVEVWDFSANTEGFVPGFSSPDATLKDLATVEHDAAEGDPDPGSLAVTIPFSAPEEKVTIALNFPAATDMSGKTLTAKVRLDSGFGTDPMNPGGAKLYAKTTAAYVYADGGWLNLDVPGVWQTLTLTLDSPEGYLAEGAWTPAEVLEIGVEFAANVAGTWETGSFHVDTIGYK